MADAATQSNRPQEYSRRDYDELQLMSRGEIFAALRSFDHAGVDDPTFTLSMVDLLDAEFVTDLSAAASSNDVAAIQKAVVDVCLKHFAKSDVEPIAAKPDTVAHAREVLTHRFTFYDEAHTLAADIDWDFNPGTAHWGHDLNRFTYLRTLTVAWQQTSEQNFARKAVDLMLDWTAKCPWERMFTGSPYVWGSYLNEAIHTQAWATAIERILPSGIMQPIELLRLLKSLHDQTAYLEIVTNGHAGNWPTIGCMGMLGTVSTLPVLRDTNRIADYCTDTLAEQIAEQVLPDGVQDELTPHYHRVVINNLLSALESLKRLDRTLHDSTLATLGRMVHYFYQTRTPDGKAIAAFNDSDPAASNDIAPRLEKLGLGAMVAKPEALKSEKFDYAGVAILRQRADKGDLYLAFDGGPFGRGHQHEDMLGFWVHAYGRSFIVDPGRHLYDSSEKSYRAHLTSTRAHSTFRIDGRDQHARGKRETWIATGPVPLRFDQMDCELRAAAEYNLGYGDDNSIAVTHRREVIFLHERCWVLLDTITGDGEHTCESRFQYAPQAKLKVEGSRVTTQYDDVNLLLWSAPATPWQSVHVEEGQENPRGGWYSSRYGLIEPAPCLVSTIRTALPLTVATLLWPYKGGAPEKVSFAFDGKSATLDSESTGSVRVQATRS